ncbi:MAG: hypothetical protein ABSF90_03620 [Syntrophobacteraceae bacterium]
MLTTTQSYVTYQGNGATTSFPFNFIVQAASQLVVSITNNNVSPAATTVLSTSQYNVTGIGNGNEFSGGSGPGGTVTYPASGSPLPSGWSITIQRVVPYTQGTSLTNQGGFYPSVVEAALDYLTMLIQQLQAAATGQVSFVGPQGPAGAAGTNGTNGTNGNTIWSGAGAPASGTGVNGDWYINTTNWTFYGPKAAGAWPGSGTSLVGPTGATGATGISWQGAWSSATAYTQGMGIEYNGMAYVALQSSTNEVPTNQGYWSQVAILPNRNRFINAEMIIDQKNNGASQSISATTGGSQYTVDRWYAYVAGSAVAGTRYAGSGPWKNYFRLTGAAGNNWITFGQRIESMNVEDLAGSTVTVSLYTASSLITALNWAAYYPSAADNYGTQTQIASGQWTINASLNQYSATFTLPSSAVNGVSIEFSSTTGLTSGTLDITGAQFEAGAYATPFDRMKIDEELMRCQRYLPGFRQSYGIFASGQATGAGAASFVIPFNVPARIAPTGIAYANGGWQVMKSTGGMQSVTGISLGSASAASAIVNMTVASGLTAGNACLLDTTSASDFILFTGSEL